MAHGAYENDVVALRGMREIFDYLPLNNKDTPEPRPTEDSRNRLEKALRYVGMGWGGLPEVCAVVVGVRLRQPETHNTTPDTIAVPVLCEATHGSIPGDPRRVASPP